MATNLLKLSNGWALGHDRRQWILYRSVKRGTGRRWKPVAYVSSTKRVLRSVLGRNGIVLLSAAAKVLDTYPDTFRDWLATIGEAS